MKPIKRRNFIKSSLLTTAGTLLATSTYAKVRTPSEVEGPFYPITPQNDKDADLTKVEGKSGSAKGEIIEVFGQVFDTENNPIEGVTIDLWQANHYGKYHHPHDSSEAPIDENFQAWAIIQSRAGGEFRFKTIIPGAYPLGASSQRAPHIHLKIGKNGFMPLLTQMYFPNNPLNESDGLYRRKSKSEQKLMTAVQQDNSNQYRYDIFLERL